MKKKMVIVFGILAAFGLGYVALAQMYGGDEDIYGDEEMMPGATVMPGPGMGMMHGQGTGMMGPGMGPGKMAQQGGTVCPMMGGMGMGGMGMGSHQMAKHNYLERIRTTDPDRYNRIMKIHDLARQYRMTEDAAKKKELEGQIRPLLDKEMKAQQADEKKRIDDMQKQIDREKSLLKERDAHWQDVLNAQFKKLTGQMDYMNFPMMPW